MRGAAAHAKYRRVNVLTAGRMACHQGCVKKASENIKIAVEVRGPGRLKMLIRRRTIRQRVQIY